MQDVKYYSGTLDVSYRQLLDLVEKMTADPPPKDMTCFRDAEVLVAAGTLIYKRLVGE